MSKVATKTNNDPKAVELKIQLRVDSIKELQKEEASVLECFGGEGYLWREVQKRVNTKINVFSIDEKKYSRFQFQGNSLKVLPSLNLQRFDIIDLDSYGIPYAHMAQVLNKRYKGIVHITCIQTGMGSLPHGLLIDLGYTKSMIRKSTTLFSRNGGDKFKNWLANHGIKKATGFTLGRKNYFWIKIDLIS